MKYIELPKRPRVLVGKVFDYETACGSIFITVTTDDDGNPMEVFITKGASGGCTQAYSEALGKMISVALRCGVDPKYVIKHLTGISCTGGSWQDGKRITSCPSAVSLALRDVIENKESKTSSEEEDAKKQVKKLRAEREKIE